MSKKLNIIEAMKMPVGTEFKIVYEDGLKANTNMILKTDEDDTKHLNWVDGSCLKVYSFLADAIFIPIQQPVSFMEVVKSGKKCKVEHELVDTDLVVYVNKKISDFNDLDWVLFTLTDNQIDIKTIIQEGKWYIEESEAKCDE